MPVYRLPVTLTAPQAGKCNNTWHIRTVGSGGGVTSDLQAATNAIRSFYAGFPTIIPSGTTVTADFAVDVNSQEDAAVTWSAFNGTGTGSLAPPHLAICVSWKTAIRARRGKGRTFVGPLVLGTVDATGTPAATNYDQVAAAAQSLVNSSLVDNGWGVCVYGLVEAAPKGTPPAAVAGLPHVGRDIIGFTIQDKFAVLRSRRP